MYIFVLHYYIRAFKSILRLASFSMHFMGVFYIRNRMHLKGSDVYYSLFVKKRIYKPVLFLPISYIPVVLLGPFKNYKNVRRN